jgi:nicotinate-nucleotide adenylyltransferase
MPEAAVATQGAIGILGGTFDPIHSAHLALAATAREKLRLERVIWVPSGQPWHRRPPLAGPAHRLAMVQLALAGQPAFEVDASEIQSDAPGYTVLTLERLRARYGDKRPLVLLLGADAFLGLPSWHRWQDLFRLAHIAVATRPGFDLAADAMPAALAEQFRRRTRSQFTALAAAPAGTIILFELSAGTVSGTGTRALLAAGENPGDWLPPGVFEYIRTHHLYTI